MNKEEQFVPQSLSLFKMMSGTDVYKVPEYQRPYSWENSQVEKLWDDIYESFQNYKEDSGRGDTTAIRSYFLGSLIVVSKGKGIEEIVDGQQRLTTLTILLKVISVLYPKLNAEIDASENPEIIKLPKIKQCIMNANDDSRLRLQSKPAFATDFDMAIMQNGDFSRLDQPKKKELVEPKAKYINTAVIFRNKLTEISAEVGDFVNYLLNNVYIIKITCYDITFAVKLFQVLNDRGLDLSPADVIKGYLMEPIMKNEIDYNRFIADWNTLSTILTGIADDDLTALMTYFLYYLLGKAPKKTLVEEMKDILVGKKVFSESSYEFSQTKETIAFIANFKKFVEEYKQIHDDNSKVTSTFFYLPWRTYWMTLLLTAKHVDYNDYSGFAKELRRFMYISYVANYNLNQLKATFVKVFTELKIDGDVKNIRKIFDDKLNELNYLERFKLYIGQQNVYEEAWLRPILLLIETYMTADEAPTFIEMDSFLHAEHILPREYKKVAGWGHITSDDENKLNSLGNFTLLGYRKNIQAKNLSFEDKMTKYTGDGRDITSYRISQEIVDDYKANKIVRWDRHAIKLRFDWMLNKISDILDIKLD